jgi:type II secretory pathway component PulF
MENTNEKDIYSNDIIIFKSVSLKDKYNFYEYLSVMLDWWVSIIESLESVESKITSPYFKIKIRELITYISSWDSFSKSMKNLPDIFPRAEISIIEAWETTGMLSSSLMKISDDLKKISDLRNNIKWALTYPVIIFLFLFLALFIVLTFVIPELKELFNSAEVELPMSTQLLISTSDFVINNLWLLFLSFLSFSLFIYWYKNTEKWKKSLENFMLWLPLIWEVYRNYILSNVASTLGWLTWSWVSIVKTLKLVWKATNNSIYEWLFDEIVMLVSSWDKIVDAMRKVDPEKIYFPADFLQMLSVWERTANLEEISIKLSDQYIKEVDYSLSNLTKWIEPLAILFAAIFVTWFSYAILWAILRVTQSV